MLSVSNAKIIDTFGNLILIDSSDRMRWMGVIELIEGALPSLNINLNSSSKSLPRTKANLTSLCSFNFKGFKIHYRIKPKNHKVY